jgi:uncharacterized membrane protein
MTTGELGLDQSGWEGDEQVDVPQQAPARRSRANVGGVERALSTLAGGFLALKGLRRGGVTGVALAVAGAAIAKRGVTGHCGIYERLNIDAHIQRPARPQDYFNHGIHVEESVTIQAPVAQVFDFWRNFENLAKFMRHVKRVQVLDDQRSHWVVEGPTGSVEWDAEIINEEPDRLISWRSLPGAEVNNTGTVQFREAPHGRGTEVRVVLEYLPPAGKLGVAIAKLLGKAPGMEVRDDLRRLRQIIETGEVPTTHGQPSGRGNGLKLRGRVTTAAVAGLTRVMGHTDRPARFARDRSATKDVSELDLGLPPRLGAEDHGGTTSGHHDGEHRPDQSRKQRTQSENKTADRRNLKGGNQ